VLREFADLVIVFQFATIAPLAALVAVALMIEQLVRYIAVKQQVEALRAENAKLRGGVG
jgi:hypothetical protein